MNSEYPNPFRNNAIRKAIGVAKLIGVNSCANCAREEKNTYNGKNS